MGITFFYKGWGLSSCGNKDKKESDSIYIDSFNYYISKNDQIESQELAYLLSFDIDCTVDKKSSIKEFSVLVESVRMLDYSDFHLTVDFCNTENVTLSSFTSSLSYVKLNYKVDTTSIKVMANVRITTNYLIDDISKFLRIGCFSSQKYEIVDTYKLLDNGYFNIQYVDNSNIQYVFDDFSESYKVMTVTTQSESFEIPEIYEGHPVKAIASRAFRDCENLKSITIPDTITSIGSHAFTECPNIERAVIPANAAIYLPKNNLKELVITSGTDIPANTFENCMTLESIIIADSILNVGSNAFAGCTNIKKAIVPTTVIPALPKDNLKEVVITSGTKIDNSAFYECNNLTSITLPNGIVSIGEQAFYNCSNLTQFTIPDSVTSIGDYAFTGCGMLENITIPNSITTMGNFVFVNCSSLTNVFYEGNIEDWCNGPVTGSAFFLSSNSNHFYLKNNAKEWEEVTSITIPDTITTIKTSQFYGFNNVLSIVLSDSIKSIGTYAFYDCSSLTSMIIPESVTSIAADAFHSCYRLVEIYNYSSLNIITGSEDYGKLGFYAKVVHMKVEPSNLFKTDDGYIFYKDFLGKLSLISYEGKDTDIILPTSMDGIKYSIHDYAFDRKEKLTDITIPNSITSIGNNVFGGCSNLMNIYYNGSIEDWCNLSFNTPSANPMFSALHFYQKNSNDEWEEVTSIEIPKTITKLGNYQFLGFNSVTSITLPNNLISIGTSSFYDCSNLESITIPNSVTSIGRDVFLECINLEYAMIPVLAIPSLPKDIVKEVVVTNGNTIEEAAFSNFSSLEKIVLPNSIKSIGNNAFGGCKNLVSITIPFVGSSIVATLNTHFGYIFGATSSNDQSQYVPVSLRDVIITGGEYITNEAFLDCSSIENITIPNSIKSIGTKAFYNCSSLKNIYYEGSIADWCKLSFKDNAYGNPMYYASHFYQKNNNKEWEEVTRIEIPDSITTIGEFQFLGFNNITSIILPEGIKSIKKSAFNRCSNLESIIIPDTVTSIGEYAFSKCESLISIVFPNTLSTIEYYTFYGCESLTEVYYFGSSAEWESMFIGVYGNETLFNITTYYYSETEPTEEGNYWHYVDGVLTKW